MTHLEEVIAHVISEAVEYADKPPEERTLPALVRKSVIQARARQAAAANNFNRMNMNMQNNGGHVGMNHINASFGQGFAQVADPRFMNKVDANQTANMLSFQNPASLQQSHQLMAQYNGLQPGQYHQAAHAQQQYAQAAQQFQLQQVQAQYQGNAASAFSHMQLQQQVSH